MTKTTDFADCQQIIRAFEKGCAYSSDERSVFAAITPFLEDTKAMADTTQRLNKSINSRDNIKKIDNELLQEAQGAIDEANSGSSAAKKALEKASGFKMDDLNPPSGAMEGSLENAASGGDQKDGSRIRELLGECFPCEWSVLLEGPQYNLKGEFADVFAQMRTSLMEWWQQTLQRFMDFIDMFKGLGNYVDVCAFLKFFTEFVCLPDLYKILAALSIMLLDISAFLDGFGIDLVLNLIVPLLLPSLTMFVDILMKFLALIIQPIECIINSITNMMQKLDFRGLKLPQKITVRGPKPLQVVGGREYWTNDSRREKFDEHELLKIEGDITVPKNLALDLEVKNLEIGPVTSFRTLGQEDYAVDPSARTSIDLSGVQSKIDVAANKYGEYIEYSRKLGNLLPSMLADLHSILRQAVAKIESLIRSVFEDLLKLFQEYGLGMNVKFGKGQMQKLAILQMIKIINTIIGLFKLIKDPNICSTEQQVGIVTKKITEDISAENGLSIYQDENGQIHIEEPDEAVDPARQIIAGADITPDNGVISSEDSQASQEKSIFQTGNPTIDAQLTDIVVNLVNPVKVVYGCPHELSIVDIQKINDWISGS